MDLVLLKTFLKVASVGSITKAAAVLFVTQSAVSRRIKQLEEHIGIPLFERSGTLLKLTATGSKLIEMGSRILEIEHNFFCSISTRQHKQKIDFCCTPSFGSHRLAGFLSSYISNHSATINFNCVFTMPEGALAGIDSGRFDIALLDHCNEIDLKDYIVHQLPDDEVVFVSNPNRRFGQGEMEISDLFNERLYLKNSNGCAKRFINKNLRLMGHSFDDFSNIIYFDDISFLINEVSVGNGITFISKEFVRDELQRGQLVAHKVIGFNHYRPRDLILARRKQSTLVEGFVDELLTELREDTQNHFNLPSSDRDGSTLSTV